MKIQDVTLRDGGYLNNWRWSKKYIREHIKAVSTVADYIELGYIGGDKEADYIKVNSPFKAPEGVSLSVMVDIADFIDDFEHTLRVERLVKIFSMPWYFSHVRIAGVSTQADKMAIAGKMLTEMGYEVFYSCMQSESWHGIKTNFENGQAFFADSFGKCDSSFSPNAHYHINCGFNYTMLRHHWPRCGIVDASLFGLGRGAGNPDLKRVAIEADLDISKLIEHEYKHPEVDYLGNEERKRTALYHYTGKLGIHPAYVYNECDAGNFGETEAVRHIEFLKYVAERVDKSVPQKYNPDFYTEWSK